MTLEALSKLNENEKRPIVINRGIGTLSLLGVALIVLKAMGYITCSWLWVLAPFWIPAVIGVLFVLILWAFIYYVIKITANNTKDVTIEINTPNEINNDSKQEPEKEVKEDTTDKVVKEKKVKNKSKKNVDRESNNTESKGQNV